MNFIVSLQASSPSPELRYTWVQEPVRFEDAIGRVIPIPSEYNWGASESLSYTTTIFDSYCHSQKLEAIIIAQFDNGPGYERICAGEYELFNTLDSSQIISLAKSEVLTPGLAITMAIIVGQYESGESNRCPRPGCMSEKVTSSQSGTKIWYVSQQLRFLPGVSLVYSLTGRSCICKAHFDLARKILPLPSRAPDQDFLNLVHRSHRVYRLRCQSLNTRTDAKLQQSYKKLRTDGRMFKNFRTQLTPLAQSPSVSNVRSIMMRIQHSDARNRSIRKASTRSRAARQQIPSFSDIELLFNPDPSSLYIDYQPPWTPLSSKSDLSHPATAPKDIRTSRSSYSKRAGIVVSEPYWLASSDRASVFSTQTA